MQFRTYFKGMDSSLALYAYAETRLGEQIEKYRFDITEAHLTFAVEAGKFCTSCHVVGAGGVEVAAEAQDAVSMYTAVDRLADKLETQLRRAKEKRSSHRNRDSIDRLPFSRPDLDPEASVDAADIISIERAHRIAHA
jgi:ribosomal subunit interface protein